MTNLRMCDWCNEPATVFKVWGQAVCLCGPCNRKRDARIQENIRALQQGLVEEFCPDVEPGRSDRVIFV